MILLLDTSTATCQLTLVIDGQSAHYEWEAGRTLARYLLKFIHEKLTEAGKNFYDISGIGVMSGPGSFTGLRIGLTVANTLADSLGVPIVGAGGENWQSIALERLVRGDNDRIVLPEYGSAAHITQAKK